MHLGFLAVAHQFLHRLPFLRRAVLHSLDLLLVQYSLAFLLRLLDPSLLFIFDWPRAGSFSESDSGKRPEPFTVDHVATCLRHRYGGSLRKSPFDLPVAHCGNRTTSLKLWCRNNVEQASKSRRKHRNFSLSTDNVCFVHANAFSICLNLGDCMHAISIVVTTTWEFRYR